MQPRNVAAAGDALAVIVAVAAAYLVVVPAVVTVAVGLGYARPGTSSDSRDAARKYHSIDL